MRVLEHLAAAEEGASIMANSASVSFAEASAWARVIDAIKQARERAADLVETEHVEEEERIAVVVNITGGILQGASATVPVDVYTIDFDLDDDQADDVILIDGSSAILGQEGAAVDPAWVASVINAPIYREAGEDEGCAECAAATETRAFPCDQCGHSDEYDDDEELGDAIVAAIGGHDG